MRGAAVMLVLVWILGSFGSYEITQDAWPAVGASLRAGEQA